jgi:UDP-N-acetylmuramate: L-alanyl-gamma-D-glutamyl-meso-diaminopimelate ligase
MRIYFMSICGTGMGNGAILMRSLGHSVTGADQDTYPPMSDRLRESGIEVHAGYDPERLEALAPDLVVVGNVNTRGNPEVEWLLETRAIPFVSLPQLLADAILCHRRTIVVTGTHGKTTTTALAASLLQRTGIDAGYLIGGVPLDLPGGAHIGASDAPFVIEGDEYDSAFFDKRSKFIHYCPRIVVLNNLEFDHADIFRDLEDIRRTFRHLLKLIPRNGWILANSDDPEVEDLLHLDWARILRVGKGDRADLRLTGLSESSSGASCDLTYHGDFLGRLEIGLNGAYNLRNAAMAILASSLVAGIDPRAFDYRAISDCRGVKRRQERLFDGKDCRVYSDFGHHPTAVRETLLALRERYPDARLVACFEPRSNTSCRKVHETAFELAFDHADEVHFGAVFRAERYPDQDRIDLPGMAVRLGGKAHAHSGNEALLDALCRQQPSWGTSVVVCFSNGSFDGVIEAFVRFLETGGTGS